MACNSEMFVRPSVTFSFCPVRYVHDVMGVCCIVISLNEVFGDIMVLASPPPHPRPPVDPDDINALTKKYAMNLFQSSYEGRYPPEVR